MSRPIEDYALVGDRKTGALVALDGSLDWLCVPRFDSPAIFAALLGKPENGFWYLGPKAAPETEDAMAVKRRYLDNTTILETTYTSPTGTLVRTDLMPTNDDRCDVVRRITCTQGQVAVRHDWCVRTDYGQIRPWVHRELDRGEEVIIAVAGPDKLILRGPRLPHAEDGHHVDDFELHEGESMTFSCVWVPSHLPVPGPVDFDDRIEETRDLENDWADACCTESPWREEVIRSLITLNLLTDHETGGIVAAATTSLPEDPGGERNWDYRFCWLRDASLTIQALLAHGRSDAANHWRSWLLRAIAGDPEVVQVMYAVDGSRYLAERELPFLSGYADSKPVRVGNAAVDQRQSDVLGELMCALSDARDAGLEQSHESWSMQQVLMENLAQNWQRPDNGLWEIRGPQRFFTHSRVLIWAAFDRAVRAVENHGLDGPVDEWRELREQVRQEVLTRGFDATRNSFTQHYDTTEVDASLLVLPQVGFIAGDDPMMLGTIAAIEQDLMNHGLLMRYRTETGVDGVSGVEHPFLACSFWLVSAYAGCGRVEEATALMNRLVGLANDVGLMSEEYDPVNQRMVGNFPQAFSHLALLGAATHLAEAGVTSR